MITKTPEERTQVSIEDLSLARQAAAGNDNAFSVLVDRYSRLIYNVALRSVSSPEDAADISQETFLKAWPSGESVPSAPGFAGSPSTAVGITPAPLSGIGSCPSPSTTMKKNPKCWTSPTRT